EQVSLAVRNLTGSGTSLFLEDAAGSILATGVSSATNYDRGISSFLIPSTGTYFVRVSGTLAATYSATILVNAVFDTEANDTSGTGQDISSSASVVGDIVSPATVVPAFLANVETNSGNSFPFSGTTTMRYQQIYSSSEFAQGGTIDALRFRRSSGQ